MGSSPRLNLIYLAPESQDTNLTAFLLNESGKFELICLHSPDGLTKFDPSVVFFIIWDDAIGTFADVAGIRKYLLEHGFRAPLALITQGEVSHDKSLNLVLTGRKSAPVPDRVKTLLRIADLLLARWPL